jgi:hypothetical protein
MHQAQEQAQAQKPWLDDAFVQEVARKADADPRSVVRRLAGLQVRGRSGKRIDAAVESMRPKGRK